MIDIPHVELELLRPADGIAAMALRPASDAGPHVVAAHLLLAVERQILRKERTRPDERHVALEDIPQLRQLVDARGAHETAGRSEPVGVGQKLAVGTPLIRHCLEFQYLENLASLARTRLSEKRTGALIGKMKPHSYYNQQRRKAD